MIGFLPLGGAREVGASCGLLTIGDARILVDAGMRPAARPGQSRTPDLERLAANPPDAIIITHAHIDHTGCLPLVAGMFPAAPIFATDSTIALTRILLQDSARIMAGEQLEREGETPLYDDAMVEETLRRMRPVGFDQPFAPVDSAPAVSARYLRAGHILGAGMVLFESPHGRVLHTGDISTGDHRTIKGVDLQRVPPADLMICEGTYGNRTHQSRKEQERALVEMVQSVVDKGGRALIPAFAVGRAQEVILILKAFRATGLISPIKIFVDGMCKSVCAVYEQQSHDLHPALQNFLRNSQRPLFMDPGLGVHAVGAGIRRDVIERGEPGLIISTSGMLSGGPAPLYAAKLAESERNAIIFTGYQDEESPGAALLRAARGDTLSIPGGSIRLNCQVARYGLSGHADAAQIEQVVRLCAPRHLVLVHGDEAALAALGARFRKIAVHVPAAGEEIVLRELPGGSAGAVPPVAASSPATAQGAPAPDDPPTAETLWAAVAARQLPPRPWTSIELGQCFYGPAYQPALRGIVEEALAAAAPFFKVRHMGSQKIYTPRSAEELADRQEAEAGAAQPNASKRPTPGGEPLPGMVVLAHGPSSPPSSAKLGWVAGPPEANAIPLLVEDWKGGRHALNTIQLITGVERPGWAGWEPEAVNRELVAWRARLDQLPVDLIAAWQAAGGEAATFARLAAPLADDDSRLAFALELLRRGAILWRREADLWLPRPIDAIHERAMIERHLALLAAAGGRVGRADGTGGALTGRGRWGMVEVLWDGEAAPAFVKDRTVLAGEGGEIP